MSVGPGKTALLLMRLIDGARTTPKTCAVFLVRGPDQVVPMVQRLAALAGTDLCLEARDRVRLHNGSCVQVRVAGTPARRGDDVPAVPAVLAEDRPVPERRQAPRAGAARRVVDRTHPAVPAGWSYATDDA